MADRDERRVTDHTRQIVATVAASRRYGEVSADLIERLAGEEAARARSREEAVKRVKSRLHQSVGAYGPGRRAGLDGELAALRVAAGEDPYGPTTRRLCLELMAHHASTRERLPHLDRFYLAVWQAAGGAPHSVIDLGCGLAPLALPWMGLASGADYLAVDADGALLRIVDGFLAAAGQPHAILQRDLAAGHGDPLPAADIALLLKLVPILDRQDASAADRLLAGMRSRVAVVSFPLRSLGGRGKGMERTYRARMTTLAGGLGERLTAMTEASVSNELVFVLTLSAERNADG